MIGPRRPRIEFYDAGSTAAGWPCACGMPSSTPRARVSRSCTASRATAAGTTAVAQHLASAGFEVHFLDRRGSGLNADEPGDVDRWQTWIDDVAVYLEQIRERAADRACAASVGAASWRRRWPDAIRD